jgi:hypothetical protein
MIVALGHTGEPLILNVEETKNSYLRTFFFFLVAPTLGNLLPLLEHRAEFPQFLDQGHSVGLLGRVISVSQGLYLYKHRKTHTHTQTLTIHALSWIGTHGHGFRASKVSARLRLLGYRDRHSRT